MEFPLEMGTKLPAHLSIIGHYLVNESVPKLLIHRNDRHSPIAQFSFPSPGEAGMRFEWSGLDKPEEQLRMLGYFFLTRAQQMWKMPDSSPAQQKIVFPGGYGPTPS